MRKKTLRIKTPQRYDQLKTKMTYSMRREFDAVGQTVSGTTQYYAVSLIKGNNPVDPGGSVTTNDADYYDWCRNNFKKQACLTSTISVKWANTSNTAQTGWVAVFPMTLDDVSDYIQPGTVLIPNLIALRQLPYFKYRTYVAGYGSPTIKRFYNRMNTLKLFGRKFDPSQDEYDTNSTAGPDVGANWYWVILWYSDTANSFGSIIDVTVKYYLTFKNRITWNLVAQ